MISHSHKRNCARSSGNPWEKFKLNDVPNDVVELVTEQGQMASDDGIGQLAWPGLLRKLDKLDPSYKQ